MTILHTSGGRTTATLCRSEWSTERYLEGSQKILVTVQLTSPALSPLGADYALRIDEPCLGVDFVPISPTRLRSGSTSTSRAPPSPKWTERFSRAFWALSSVVMVGAHVVAMARDEPVTPRRAISPNTAGSSCSRIQVTTYSIVAELDLSTVQVGKLESGHADSRGVIRLNSAERRTTRRASPSFAMDPKP